MMFEKIFLSLNKLTILSKYILFVVISICANILFQYISFTVYNGFFSIYVSMIVGTLAALVLKYILDKKFIFYYESENKKDDSIKFFIYSFLGVFTTAIFWIFELGFHYLFQTDFSKYLGAILGLIIGYCIKYKLDKKYVFN